MKRAPHLGWQRGVARFPIPPEEPIRSELFSIERLEAHAESLAAAQQVAVRPSPGRPLSTRIAENAKVLTGAYRIIAEATRDGRTLTPAAEWLLDNFHLVDEQIQQIRRDLPPRYYHELPKLVRGHLEGYPRIFGIAWAFIAHTDSRFDLHALVRFVNAYQHVQPLTIGELWAIAITIRIILVENLRRLADAILCNRDARQEADAVADRLLNSAKTASEQLAEILSDYDQGPLPSAFAAQLDHRLRDQDAALEPALQWLSGRLAAQESAPDRVLQDELRLQGALNVTVRNVITSMRLISEIDWANFFERVSVVDAVLRADSDFGAMDFATRDLYRRAIERLARGSGLTEIEVTRRAISRAKKKPRLSPQANRERDPGYHLIARGLHAFEREIGFKPPPSEWLRRLNHMTGGAGYIILIVFVTGIAAAAAVYGLSDEQLSSAELLSLFFLALVPASDLAIALINRAVTHRIGPEILPGMELAEGVPSSLRTMIAMPVLLTGPEQVEELVERLEVHYLATSEGDLYFALVSDWTDADTENAPGDDIILSVASERIRQLNSRYGPAPGGGDRFLLLHRRRVWNESQGLWMGWERKRGKLHELNRVLRGASDTSFLLNGGKLTVPQNVRYVITLDADTRLPRESAKRLIGKMAHALNRPKLDPESSLVVEGYGILQPRVTPSLPIGRESSLFQRVFAAPRGLDPYAFAVSDVYQDLFQEGSYTGKGIYDVDIFEAALSERFPDNSVLSHDLLEGIVARAGLVSEIEVVEEFPSRYDVASARQHRWVRGDWQLLPWIIGFGRDPRGRKRNIANLIGRWKMVDNLRRSLSSPATLLALLYGWMLPLRAATLWTAFIIATIVLPLLLPWLGGLVPRQPGLAKRTHLRSVAADLAIAAIQTGFLITFLAHQAWLVLDAVARTLFRLLRRRRLLEWVTAAQVSGAAGDARVGIPRNLVVSIAFAAVVLSLLYFNRSDTQAVAAPFLTLWGFSPIVAWWASKSAPTIGRLPVAEADAKVLRKVARRTWRFLEIFVTAADRHLPPDNFQEDPKPTLARRTSPTNIGLYLLSVLSARDFGWLGTFEALDRLEATLNSMKSLERFQGHFYNWYATEDGLPLHPKYISTVDSGNLAGHLIVVAQACLEMQKTPLAAARRLEGMVDAFELASDALDIMRSGLRAPTPNTKRLRAALDAIGGQLLRAASADAELVHSLSELSNLVDGAASLTRDLVSDSGIAAAGRVLTWLDAMSATVHSHRRDLESAVAESETAVARLQSLANSAMSIFRAMTFEFLYDEERQLFSIGYRVEDASLDPNCYDLLASEARLASFIAIAQEDVPPKHWFRLGRALTSIGHGAALISWSGSMFEYLMPSLVMRAPTDSILDQTNRLVVKRQIQYGRDRGVPWGISESLFYARDIESTYQYSGFGVPDLGYKRGLSDNLVIAPYATALAAMVDPKKAAKNFERLTKEGARGEYGLYEALDYTASRLPEGAKVSIVRAYMAHHQAMSIVAIANALLNGEMRDRFHASPMIKATELLLQERMPRGIAVSAPPAQKVHAAAKLELDVPEFKRRFYSPHSRIPRTHLLSNGTYAVMITGAGSGYSRWRNLDVTRWREDVTCDNWGSYIFLRDVNNGETWSAAYQPTCVDPDYYEVSFFEGRAEFVRQNGSLKTVLEVAVSPEHDGEVRRVSITNSGTRTREIELTSYAELVLAGFAEDIAHPAFSKLFVQTEFIPNPGTLLATRRRKSPEQEEVWAAHLLVIEGESVAGLQFETNRERFLGRSQRLGAPQCVVEGWPLSNTAGCVLDAIFSLRSRVRVPPGQTVRLSFWTIVAGSRQEALDLADKHRDPTAFDRVNTLAWTQAQGHFHHLGSGPEEAHLFQRIANRVIYSDPALRPPSHFLKRNGRNISALWAHGISGDLPLVLLQVNQVGDIDFVRQLLRAFEYWRLKRLAVDLVILNERPTSYLQDLQAAIDHVVRPIQSRPKADEEVRGNVFVLRTDVISQDVTALLQTVARVVLSSRRGTVADQVYRIEEPRPAVIVRPKLVTGTTTSEHVQPRPVLEFFNGFGGFADDGREYVTILEQGRVTPAPWINVIANENFGFQVSTDGGGFTWSLNSQQNRLTPWSNDPVLDSPGEAIFLRDTDTGDLWSPTPLPIRQENAAYIIHHGQGYSRFELESNGLATDLLQYVAIEDPVKISRLKITNRSRRSRNISITAYVEWVLGTSRAGTAPHIQTEMDPETGAMFARNPLRNEHGTRVAFTDLDGRQSSWTGDRSEFLGRNGRLERPIALLRGTPLSNQTGAGFDPCGALQTTLTLRPSATVEIVFVLGEAASTVQAQALVTKYRTIDHNALFGDVTKFWGETLSTVQLKTPDRALDIIFNRWLLYQTLACRLWARSAFYQSSGAYGFRDQLQDSTAVAIARSEISRRHLLRAAARQFPEGDVQHWWLPETGGGVRTRVSDDRVWLAYVAAHYVKTTGDSSVLDEQVPFIEGPLLQKGEYDAFFQPPVSEKRASLFEHCARALDGALSTGSHGLPLIGTGDWNDGMNRVGDHGTGESVWLGWFLYQVLTAFSAIADKYDSSYATRWRTHAAQLKEALEQAWDGDWYRRAYFDDGTPLGSVVSSECRIDSIVQSWSVLSGAGEPARTVRAMAAFEKYLVRRDEGLVLLFTPPFERAQPDPGYVKGYPPGIRENGGQYTHAALWSVIAFAMLGDGDKAHELLRLLNPIQHAGNSAAIHRYKVEPYAVCADVYSEPPYVGQGGWTWYTGSAAWMYRAVLEGLLGIKIEGASLVVNPCIPREWAGFEVRLRHGRSVYEIAVRNPNNTGHGVVRATWDGVDTGSTEARFDLQDDGATHHLQIILR